MYISSHFPVFLLFVQVIYSSAYRYNSIVNKCTHSNVRLYEMMLQNFAIFFWFSVITFYGISSVDEPLQLCSANLAGFRFSSEGIWWFPAHIERAERYFHAFFNIGLKRITEVCIFFCGLRCSQLIKKLNPSIVQNSLLQMYTSNWLYNFLCTSLWNNSRIKHCAIKYLLSWPYTAYLWTNYAFTLHDC